MFKIIYLFGIKRTVKDNKIYCSNTLMFFKKKSFSYAGYNGNVKISLVLEIFSGQTENINGPAKQYPLAQS